MTRKEKLILNSFTSILYRVVCIAIGLVLPRMYLVYFGSTVNGLVNSIARFLGFISLAECGVGAVVQSSFYKPLAENNSAQISRVFLSSENFFRKIAYFLVVYTAVLVAVYPFIVSNDFGWVYTAGLIIAMVISTFAQYYFGITYRLLLNSDQLSFVHYAVSITTLIVNAVGSIVMMKAGFSIHAVKLFSSVIHLLEPFVLRWYVKKHYSIDRKVIITEEPIKQKWNGLSQHIATVVLDNTDTVVLTLFSSLENVSIYSVYFMVANGIKDLAHSATSGVQALLGNLLACNETKRLNKVYSSIEWLIHTGTTLLFTITGILIVPFVFVYTRDITDANYIMPIFAVLLTIAEAARSVRLPYNLMVHAAGHFKQTQSSALIEAGINVVISVAAVFKFGLVGVAIGTLAAMVYRTCYLAWYLSKNILFRDVKYYIAHIAVDIICAAIMVMSTKFMIFNPENYTQWIVLACKVSAVCTLECIAINSAVYMGQIKEVFRLLKSKSKNA